MNALVLSVGLETLHIYSIRAVQTLCEKNVIILDINREIRILHCH